MTKRMSNEEIRAVTLAADAGEVIQCQNLLCDPIKDDWHICDPKWEFSTTRYRAKPKPIEAYANIDIYGRKTFFCTEDEAIKPADQWGRENFSRIAVLLREPE